MARCFLGRKKTAKIAEILGKPINHAVVRGGWTHFWALAVCEDGSQFYVNYKTGESKSAELPKKDDS